MERKQKIMAQTKMAKEGHTLYRCARVIAIKSNGEKGFLYFAFH